jgi:UDP-N-acetylmuramoyl-tripeptide--D-alanyl-D-alanine ligase
MGMRGMGEIALLSQITRPDIAVITNVGTAHIGRLGSEQAIAAAKCELLHEMPATSIAVLNHDNLRLMETAAKVWQGKTITYGLEGGDLQGKLLDATTLRVGNVTVPLPLPGRHNALNYLAALAVARVLQIDWSLLMQGLSIELPQGRARRYDLPNDIVLLDETYNAGLESMTAALQLLADTPAKRRIAVLGTMKELGDRSPDFHRQVGEMVKQLNLDGLLILADAAESQALAEGAWPLIAEQFATHEEVVQRLQKLAQPGDRILFKASRAVGLDQVVDRMRAGLQRQEIG